ncbi:hypothetical protein B0H14DRAFT_3527454 [Mycena olivaceomarginata]|nr:hypothetical protein B0H14DRAFT_3527454 [Mycena olivaceomarginata]
MAGSKKGPIWDHFHEVEGTNTKHSCASCRACVKNTLNRSRNPRTPSSTPLFGKGVKSSLRTRVSRRAQEEEEIYMQVMAELDAEDDTPDDGAIEIDDDEVWGH